MPNNNQEDSNTYRVFPESLKEILGKDEISYKIPIYQRQFSWKQKEVSQMLSDIFPEDHQWLLVDMLRRRPYFLGSFVFIGNGDRRIVLDGQQRLITISLLISVIHQLLKDSGTSSEKLVWIRKYLMTGGFEEDVINKLTLQGKDSEFYKELIIYPQKFSQRELRKHLLSKSIKYMYQFIEGNLSIAERFNTSPNQYYSAMFKELKDNLRFIRIQCSTEEDAFKLFETLNDRGLALSAADLIKNKILSRCETKAEEVYGIWNEMLDFINPDDLTNYLRYFWIMENSFVRKNDLYENFDSQIRTMNPQEVKELTINLRESAILYSDIANPSNGSFSNRANTSLDRIRKYKVRSARPALLACAKYSLNHFDFFTKVCEIVAFRYFFSTDKNPNIFEKIFSKIANRIRENPTNVHQIVIEEISGYIPKDDEVRSGLLQKECWKSDETWRAFLEGINSFIAGLDDDIVVSGSEKVHIEHILPQTPLLIALKESSLGLEEAQEFIPKIGNITLWSGRRNSAAKNKPFSEKKEDYKTSNIIMTRKLKDVKKWDRNQIKKRTEEFIEMSLEIWPWPIS